MKRFISMILFALLSLTLFGVVPAKESKEENSIILAKNRKFAFKTVRGSFAESASKYSKRNLLRFYKQNHIRGKYKAVATIYRRTKGINRYTLPEPKYTWSIMQPIVVFFDNADRDSDNEIIIIERNMTGIGPNGSRSFYRTRVYDWNGKRFRHLEKVSKYIGKARTKARVKLLLKRMLNKKKVKRIIFRKGEYSAQATGKFTPRNQKLNFKVNAKRGQRMIVNIIPITRGLRTAGQVTSPTKNITIVQGRSGVIVNRYLRESGDYKIIVTPARIGRSRTAEFIVEVILLPRRMKK